MNRAATLILTVFILISASPLHADSLINCGNGKSASLGNLKQEVRLKCGEPERTEIIGYIDRIVSEERIRVMKIEEWIYSVSYYGGINYYSLVFEGNTLVKIQKAGHR
jgi:hypothetical protein